MEGDGSSPRVCGRGGSSRRGAGPAVFRKNIFDHRRKNRLEPRSSDHRQARTLHMVPRTRPLEGTPTSRSHLRKTRSAPRRRSTGLSSRSLRLCTFQASRSREKLERSERCRNRRMAKAPPPTGLPQPTTSRSPRGRSLRRIKPQQPVVNDEAVRRNVQVVRAWEDIPREKSKELFFPAPHLLV